MAVNNAIIALFALDHRHETSYESTLHGDYNGREGRIIGKGRGHFIKNSCGS
jgi:hypothetical protein